MAPKKKNQKHTVDQKRLSLFLRYLEEHNAKIEIKNKNGHTFIYTTNQNDGNPSIRSLLMQEPLNLSKNTVSELFLDWPITSEHSYKKRIRENLKIIEGITFYLKSDGRVDEATNTLKADSPFGVKNQHSGVLEIKRGEQAFIQYDELGPVQTAQDCDPNWGQYLGELYEEFPAYVESVIKSYTALGALMLSFMCKASIFNLSYRTNKRKEFKHIQLLKQLPKIYSDTVYLPGFIRKTRPSSLFQKMFLQSLDERELNTKEQKFENAVSKTLQQALDLYRKFRLSDTRNGYLMPNYRDFHVPERIELSRSFEEFSKNNEIAKINLNDDLDVSWAIENRYELLQLFIESEIHVKDWNSFIHSILVLVYFEYVAFNILVNKSVNKLLSDTRFIVSGSKEKGDIDYQKDSLNLKELSDLLSGYLFKKGMKNTINVNDSNILSDSIYRFSNKDAVKGKIEPEEIRSYINSLLREYYRKRIIIDNFIDDQLIQSVFGDNWE